jgi:hypothetical protein
VSLAHANLRDKGLPCLRDPNRLSPRAMAYPLEPYQYEDLPTQPSFSVIVLLPGQEGNPVSCLLHIVDWSNSLGCEAISYAWGDLSARAPVTCHGKRLEMTQNLHRGLTQLRLLMRLTGNRRHEDQLSLYLQLYILRTFWNRKCVLKSFSRRVCKISSWC